MNATASTRKSIGGNAVGKTPDIVIPSSIEDACLELAYSFDGSLEGFFSAVFAAYERHESPNEILRMDCPQLRLGQQIAPIDTDIAHAQRVADGLANRFGSQYLSMVKEAFCSDKPDTPTAIYRFIRFSLDTKVPYAFTARRNPLRQTTHPLVFPVLERQRAVSYEAERARQFVRFQHMSNNVWFARYKPNASVIPLVMPWFAARYNTQQFVIYDEAHCLAGVYDGRTWYLVPDIEPNLPEPDADEALMQAAWRLFYRTIAIDERYNPELRRTNMPVRFWENLTEMQDETGTALTPKRGPSMPRVLHHAG